MFLARLLVLFSLVCISCAHSSFEQKQLKHALDFATSNRLELEILRLSCNSWGITLCNFPFMHTPLLIYTGRTSYLPLHEMKP